MLSRSAKRIYYASDPKGTLWDIYEKDVDGGSDKLLVSNPENDYIFDLSPDERHLLYAGPHGDSDSDVWAVPLSGEGKPFFLVKSPAYEGAARFSPSGRWFAYTPNESGRLEIYAQPFPGPGARIQITTGGALDALTWTTRGEIIYPALTRTSTVVPVTESGTTLVPGTPYALPDTVTGWPTPDGQRFLSGRVVANAPPRSIILNWKPPKR